LLTFRQLPDQHEHPLHLSLVVDSRIGEFREMFLGPRLGDTFESRRMPPLIAPLVPHDVRRDAEEPREDLVRGQILTASAPGFEKDDREGILRCRPVTDPPEAIVVDHRRVAFEQQAESVRVASARTRPEGRIVEVQHLPMSVVEAEVPADRILPLSPGLRHTH
jgi:hypothetical protein